MTDSVNTMIMDLPIGKKIGRPLVVTGVCIISFLLQFVVMSECIASTTIYRYKEIVGQVGWPAWILYQVGYFAGIISGIAVGHTVSEGAGAGVGFGIFFAFMVACLFIAKTPDCDASGFMNKNAFTRKLWWIAFYSVSTLTALPTA
jgi:solute carrier family 6 (neurotransmitter transporter, GABA) member 1